MRNSTPHHLSWAFVVHGQGIPGGGQVVRAMNDRDAGQLEAALAGVSHPQRITLSWIRTQKDHGTHYDLIGAAVAMNWTGALPVLFAAGLQPSLEHLEQATLKKRSAAVKLLLAQGLDPNGERSAPPLRVLAVEDVRAEKHAPLATVARHYAKAGVDPWARCTTKDGQGATLVEHLLEHSHLSVVEVLLESARQRQLDMPNELAARPQQAWQALARGFQPYLEHSHCFIQGATHVAMHSLMANMRETFGPVPDHLAMEFWQRATTTFEARPSAHRAQTMHEWAQDLLVERPDLAALQAATLAFFQQHAQHLAPEVASHWEGKRLEACTPSIRPPILARHRL